MPVTETRWSLIGIVLAMGALACDGRRAESPATTAETRQVPSCAVSEPAKFVPGRPDSTAKTVDLECDGTSDTIVVRRVTEAGVTIAQLRIGNRTPYHFRDLDGVPTLVEAVDLDGDGVRDLLLVLIDESTVLPLIVRVTRTEIERFDESALDWRQLQYVWAEEDNQDSCTEIVAPHSETDVSRKRYVRVRASLGDTACAQATSLALVVHDGGLRVDSLITQRLRTGP